MEVSLSRALVRLLLQLQREGLPQAIRDKALLHIADTLGVGLAAAGSGALATSVVDAMRMGADGGRCGVLGSPHRLAPPAAAFANAALMHLLDFDDIHDAARLHPTPVALAAALAAAPLSKGAGQGARVVDAVALGDELICRLGAMLSPTGTGPGSDWFLTQLFGYMGAALAAGIVMGHSEDRIVSAMGLAYMQVAGGKQAGFGTGSNARAIYPAFAAQGGVQASLIASAEIIGPEHSLDGAAGLFKIYLGLEACTERRAQLLAHKGWAFEAVQIKPWPCCRLSHPYVVAAQDVRAAMLAARASATDVERIDVAVNQSAAKLCCPLEQRRRPDTLQDAKYSIPWMTAFTLAHGRVDLQTLGDHALLDAGVLTLADHVHIHETLPDNPGHPPAEISVTLKNGQVIVSAPVGDVAIDAQQVRAKFDACLAHAGQSEAEALALWSRLSALHEEADVDFIFAPA
jgi:2-methylcitrate dehydratase PrpD